jgi:hypothetical protein
MPKTKRIRKNHWVLVIACTAGAVTIGAAIAPATSAPRGLTSQGERGTVKRTKTKVNVSLTWRADRHGGGEAFRGTVSVPTGLKLRGNRAALRRPRGQGDIRGHLAEGAVRAGGRRQDPGAHAASVLADHLLRDHRVLKGKPGSYEPGEDAIAAVRSGELRADLGTS